MTGWRFVGWQFAAHTRTAIASGEHSQLELAIVEYVGRFNDARTNRW